MSWAVIDIRRICRFVIREEEFQCAVLVVTRAWNLEVEDCAKVVWRDERKLGWAECDIGKVFADRNHQGWRKITRRELSAFVALVTCL